MSPHVSQRMAKTAEPCSTSILRAEASGKELAGISEIVEVLDLEDTSPVNNMEPVPQ